MIDEKKLDENSNSFDNKDYIFNNKELDFLEIFRATKRKWKIFTASTLIFFSLGVFYVNYKTPIWEGKFRIVIAKKNASYSFLRSLSSTFSQQSFFQSFLSGNEIDTELEILESPSVLKPVFEFVKNEKLKRGIDISNLKFSKWKKDHFEIKKIKRTPVLNISYFDEEKDLVEPTLVKISKEYQNYSGRDRSENLNRVLDYLDNQITIYKKKNQLSFSDLQKFAMTNNLPFPRIITSQSAPFSFDGYDLEKDRLEEAFKIDLYQKQLEQLDALTNDSRTLTYIGGLYKEVNIIGLTKRLQAIDTEIALLKTKLKEIDPFLIKKINERRAIFDELLYSTKALLKAKLFESNAKYEASERPKEVLLTFSELLRNSANFSNTLNNLKKQKEVISLERARSEKPWELITPVNVLDIPFAPRKLRIVVFSIFLGSIFGVIFSSYKDYKSGLIYQFSYFQNNLKYKFLTRLFSNNVSSINQIIELLKRGPLKINKKDSIGLVIPFQNKSDKLDNFLKEFKIVFKDYSIKISSNILETENCEKRIMIILPGFITRNKLKSIQEEINLQDKNLEGWIYLD